MKLWARAGVPALVLLAAAGPALAGAPTEQVRQYTDQIQKILEDPSLAQADKAAAVRKVATEVFDVQETAKRALGRHWHARTAAEREEFTRLFADLLERTYIGKLDQYRGERVIYTNEVVDGPYAVVRAKIVGGQRPDVPVEAKLLQKNGRWLVYDLAVEGISLIANYRSQFDRIIRTSSFEELVSRLKHKRDELLQTSRPAS